VARTVAFYEGMFGATRIEETRVHDVPLVRLDLHGTELWVSGEIVPGLRTHYGLVADDFEEALAELTTRGVTFLSQPVQVSTWRLAIVVDSDGQQISIATRA
jgi:predicted enzyme related to lactoylglutathione lyase